MPGLREKIYQVIDGPEDESNASRAYNYVMICVIVLSLIPLAFKDDNLAFEIIDKIAVTIFIIDYVLRLATADFKFKKHSLGSFLRYPFSPMAIIDLLSILPSLLVLNEGFKALRVLRMIRAMRVIRVFRVARYSKSFRILGDVLRESRTPLIAVVCLAVGYVLVAALVIFNVEPDTFNSFFDAIYWATVSLTTVGYGDIYPVTMAGQIITMLSSVFGIAVVALPAGIITAGYMNAINKRNKETEEEPSSQ